MSEDVEKAALVAEIRAIIAEHGLAVRGTFNDDWAGCMDVPTLRFFLADIRHAAGLPPGGNP